MANDSSVSYWPIKGILMDEFEQAVAEAELDKKLTFWTRVLAVIGIIIIFGIALA